MARTSRKFYSLIHINNSMVLFPKCVLHRYRSYSERDTNFEIESQEDNALLFNGHESRSSTEQKISQQSRKLNGQYVLKGFA